MPKVSMEVRTGRDLRPDHIIAEDGTRLFVRDWGAGRPVLFLSGWTLPSDFWGYQMVATVRGGYRAVAYDRRGHGRSSDPGQSYDHDTLSDDLAAVIETLSLDDVVLVAHSMGCTEIARYFARHGRGRVSKVVLVGAITPCFAKSETNPNGLDPTILEHLRAPLAIDFPAWIAANTEPFFVPETSPGMIAWGQGLMLQTSLLAAIEMARANAETDFRADVGSINVPTLLIHGDRDASAPLDLTAKPTQALIRGARLQVYEGAPHGLPLTHAQRLNADIADFLADG
ncbi:alpha/beta fold hydrolase [Tabrizicola sp.]|uniref:alpha/beta fold hydrolase n=1 Tax=Tabrizicola sp. TaxID=2005166 RepID=UPI003F412687